MQGCAHDASCAATPTTCPISISYLGWNPVQGGNRCNNGSPVNSYSFQSDRMVHSISPLHWNPNWDFPDCTNDGCDDPALLENRAADVVITQSLRFVRQHVLELRYTLTETAGLDHGITLQRCPPCMPQPVLMDKTYGNYWMQVGHKSTSINPLTMGSLFAVSHPVNHGSPCKMTI